MSEQLPQFVRAAKAILYDAKRLAPLLAMLETTAGAVNAVHTVMAAIEHTKPVPQDIKSDLSISILALLIEAIQESGDEKVKPELADKVIQALKAEVAQPTQPTPAQQPPQGLINQGV